ncbi:MAG: ribosomal-processing cysteine protease Prp [Lawsonibacter sp.]|nr:ribosomal-processing cysteine protease Prp [Lawsonibacter sp.]
MTTVTFYSQGGRLTGFQVEGHSGYAPQGEDIVCAAVTSAVRMAECAVNDVLGLEAPVKVREEDAFISLKLPRGLEQPGEDLCQTLLAALLVHMVQLSEEYPDFISVLEV